jgi:glycosyltransferase involved in cell wall biosynthesis
MVHADRIVALTEANKRRLLETYRRSNIVAWHSRRKEQTPDEAEREYLRIVGDREIDPDKVVVIPLGIDASHFDIRDLPVPEDFAELRIAEHAAVVLYAARLVPMKGILNLLEAARTYGSDGNTHTVVVGGGVLADRVREECQRIGNVHFLGFKSQDELPAYYNAVARHNSVFCVPSRSEGLSVAYLEAMACGMRVVASCYEDMGEMDIMAPPWTSFVPFGQVSALANEVRRVLSSTSTDHRHEIRVRALPYGKDRFVERMSELYESVTSGARSYSGEQSNITNS